jgi:hypothetical protein
MSDLTLYKITDNLPALLETLDMVPEGTPERQEIEAEIQEYLTALPSKVDGISHVWATLDAIAGVEKNGKHIPGAVDREIERLKDIKATAERQRDLLKQYLADAILRLPEPKKGARKIASYTNELQLRRTQGAVVIEDEAKVPTAYKDIVVRMTAQDWGTIKALGAAYMGDVEIDLKEEEFVVRKADIKKDLQAGAVIPGADLKFGWTVVRK